MPPSGRARRPSSPTAAPDRVNRWMVGIAIALAAALAVQMMAMQAAVADLQSGQRIILDQLDRQQLGYRPGSVQKYTLSGTLREPFGCAELAA